MNWRNLFSRTDKVNNNIPKTPEEVQQAVVAKFREGAMLHQHRKGSSLADDAWPKDIGLNADDKKGQGR